MTATLNEVQKEPPYWISLLPKQLDRELKDTRDSFGAKLERFWSRDLGCRDKKVNACGNIPLSLRLDLFAGVWIMLQLKKPP